MSDMDRQLEKIRKAYDRTVEQYYKDINVFAGVPEDIKDLPGYEQIVNNPSLGSNATDIAEYLKPHPGIRYLDAGCCANLANHRLDKWPCVYYGVDISPALINAMRSFVDDNRIPIGGLYLADVSQLPFDDEYFDIASLIGVLEYCTLDYTQRSLQELHRVLKSDAKVVLDIPNLAHPYTTTMFRLEEYLGRPNIPTDRAVFEGMLAPLFHTDRVDDSQVILKYFVRKRK